MQTMNFLVLTKSAKHNELCIAGVDLNTNKFTRLVADSNGKEIKKSDFFAGREVQILDIIEVLVSPAPLKIQSENVVLHKINKIINTLDFVAADKIMTNITNNANLLQTQDYAIQAQDIHAYNKSLMIAEVENFETYYNGRKTKAKFEFKGKTYTNFSVTDYDYFTKITRHNKCKLILSIPESEWNGAHFKFIAKVFYSEKNSQNSQNTLNDYAKQQLSVLKIALQTQDETLIKYQLSKLKAASELSELCSLVEMGANAQALMLIDGFLTQKPSEINDDGYLDYLTSQGEFCENAYESPSEHFSDECYDESGLDRLIAWADENEISADKFPRDKESLKNLKELDLGGYTDEFDEHYGLETLPDEFANLQSLEKLNLYYNKFKEFPKVICELKNLKELDLRCGDYEEGYYLEYLPDDFANLQRLEKLNLYYNKFKEFPKAICELKNLREIYLYDCGLKSLPDKFANLQSLERLDLFKNNFQEFPRVICKLENLKELDLRGGDYREGYYLEYLPDDFANLQSLEKLSLRWNKFQEFPKVILRFKNLKGLDLGLCFLKSLPDEFANLQSLEKLDLNGNKFKEFPKVILKLKNLKELNLLWCDLKSLPDEFANLQRLERLDLSGNYFQEFPKAICKLTNLKELNLWRCCLKSLPDEFANLQKLEKLKLSGNNFKEFPKVIYKLKNLKECDIKETDRFNKIKEIDIDSFDSDDTELPF